MEILDCAIIGAGPGGLVAALYLRRYKRSVAIFDAGHSRAQYIPKIRNLIGYTNGISGKQLLKRLKKQVEKFDVKIISENAVVHRHGKIFEVTAGHKTYRARKVIISTGMRDIQPPVDNYWDLCSKGVLAYCPICDGFEQSEKKLAVIIDRDHGFRKVRFLASFSNNLHVIAIKKFKLSPTHVALMRKMKIKVYWGQLQKLSYHAKNKTLVVKQAGRKPYQVQLAYVALGAKVNSSALKHLYELKKTSEGFLKMTSHQETSIPGLYAVGDCANALSQISVAVGHAAIAATHVHNVLNKNRKL